MDKLTIQEFVEVMKTIDQEVGREGKGIE